MNTVLSHRFVRRIRFFVVVLTLTYLYTLTNSPAEQTANRVPLVNGMAVASVPRGSMGGG